MPGQRSAWPSFLSIFRLLSRLKSVFGDRPQVAEQRSGADGRLACARRRRSPRAFVRLQEVKDDVESTSDGQVAAKVYAFRRPRFPVVYAVGRELLAATSPAALQRQLRRLDLQGVDMIDTTGEGWAFHPESMIVSRLTIKKRWTKLEVIRLFNASDNSRSRSPRPRGVQRQPSPSCTIRSASARPAAGRSRRSFRPCSTFEMRVGEAPRRVYTDPDAAWTPEDARQESVRA